MVTPEFLNPATNKALLVAPEKINLDVFVLNSQTMDLEMEFMDVDGPEFLLDVNNQIANFRANYDIANTLVTASDIFEYTNNNTSHAALEAYEELAVLDTNFLLSKLGYLDTVLDLANENPGSLLVLLPWVVIRELDGLKSSKNNSEVSVNARKAMRFIEMRLRDKIISLRGQKMNEVWDKSMLQGHNTKGDDRILDCCMYFQQLTQRRITLFSNDRNLCIKVMVHDMDSISAESTPKMEALLNRIASNRKIVSAYNTEKYKKPSHHVDTKRHPIVKQEQSAPIPQAHHEDYVMDIDEFYPINTVDTNHHPVQQTEDCDMMVDDDYAYISLPANTITDTTLDKSQGTSASKWANAPYTSHKNSKPLAYLDNDPTLVAPKRPFRPEHHSYSWAANQPR